LNDNGGEEDAFLLSQSLVESGKLPKWVKCYITSDSAVKNLLLNKREKNFNHRWLKAVKISVLRKVSGP
jgi:hypothetical protein